MFVSLPEQVVVEEKKVDRDVRYTGKTLRPDTKYGSTLVSKFINCLMWDGKKSTAEAVFYGALSIIEEKIKDVEPIQVFEAAIQNVKPMVEVRSKRVGGATYQVPVEVPRKRQLTLAIRWIITCSRSRKGQKMAKSLSAELLDAYKKEGAAMTIRTNAHKMAEANRAFAHFA
jgi:small subunit ribosomal protein S7